MSTKKSLKNDYSWLFGLVLLVIVIKVLLFLHGKLVVEIARKNQPQIEENIRRMKEKEKQGNFVESHF